MLNLQRKDLVEFDIVTKSKMAAAAILNLGKALWYLKRLTDFHQILTTSRCCNVPRSGLAEFDIYTKSKMAAAAILNTEKVL